MEPLLKGIPPLDGPKSVLFSLFSYNTLFSGKRCCGHSTPYGIPCNKNLASPSPAVPPIFTSQLFGWSAGARAELDFLQPWPDCSLLWIFFQFDSNHSYLHRVAIFSRLRWFGLVCISALIRCYFELFREALLQKGALG